MTENEKKLMEQIMEMMEKMNTRFDKIEDSLAKSDSKMDKLNGETSTSVESKLDDLKGVNKVIQDTFEQGFADVHKGLAEIKEVNKNRKTAKEIAEGIARNGQKQKG
ncbi:chromosome segregation protein SMC, partial [Bacillus wiedmannii]